MEKLTISEHANVLDSSSKTCETKKTIAITNIVHK